MVKNPLANAGDAKRRGFDPWVGKTPWKRAWQTTPVLLPGESHGQRSLAGYSPWGCKESDTTEATQQARTHVLSTYCVLVTLLSAGLQQERKQAPNLFPHVTRTPVKAWWGTLGPEQKETLVGDCRLLEMIYEHDSNSLR